VDVLGNSKYLAGLHPAVSLQPLGVGTCHASCQLRLEQYRTVLQEKYCSSSSSKVLFELSAADAILATARESLSRVALLGPGSLDLHHRPEPVESRGCGL
jgi:hypothetical protein